MSSQKFILFISFILCVSTSNSQIKRLSKTNTKSIPATDCNIQIEGSNYVKKVASELILHRHSDEIYNKTTAINLFNPIKARTSSGILIKFKTKSPLLNVKFKMLEGNKEAPKFTVFQNNELDKTVSFKYQTKSEVSIPIESKHPNKEVEYKITFPIWTDVSFTGIELEKGNDLAKFSKKKKPIYLAYGNSITHGRGQLNTYQTYPYILAELLEHQFFNLGVGGGKVSQTAAEMIASDFKNIDIMTVLIGYNDLMSGKISPEIYMNRYNKFLTTVRKSHPKTKIFCITLTHTTKTSNKEGITPELFRKVVRTIVNKRRSKGDKNIYLIEGDRITTEADLKDPVHLNIEGATNFAHKLYKEIKGKL